MGIAAAADSTVKVGADALRQIIQVDAGTAQALMSMLGIVADSVATASKAAIEVGKAAAQKKAAEASKKISEEAQAMAEKASRATEAQTDSLKQALKATRAAIDSLISDLEKEDVKTNK